MSIIERRLRWLVGVAVMRLNLYDENDFADMLPEGTMSWVGYSGDNVTFCHDDWTYCIRVDFWTRIVYIEFASHFEGARDSRWSLDYLLSSKELFS